MAMLLTILGFGLFICAIRTINRWHGGRIPIQMQVMIGIVGVVVLLMGLYLLTAPQVPQSIPSDIGNEHAKASGVSTINQDRVEMFQLDSA
jgi:hypothetical protein